MGTNYSQDLSTLFAQFTSGKITRRQFLKALGLVLGSEGIHLASSSVLPSITGRLPTYPSLLLRHTKYNVFQQPQLRWTTSLLRPDDLLKLDFEFYNVRLNADRTRLERIPDASLAYMVVKFPPQHVLEEAAYEEEPAVGQPIVVKTTKTSPSRPLWNSSYQRLETMRAVLSKQSHLGFEFPVGGIEYSVEALLNWVNLSELLSVTIDPNGIDRKVDPPFASNLTALEMPYAITLVPDPASLRNDPQATKAQDKWVSFHPVLSKNNRRPLWHTRRIAFNEQGSADPGQPVKLYFGSSAYFQEPPPFQPDGLAITKGNAVSLLSQYDGRSGNHLRTELITLTALGGWLKLRDVLHADNETVIGGHWIHVMTMGRDHFVRIVTDGFLYPFGHRAALIQVSERNFIFQDRGAVPAADGVIRDTISAAYLLKKQYLVVREQERDYDALASQYGITQGRVMPFKRVRLVTEVTPLLDANTAHDDGWFWPTSGARKFEFDIVATDKNIPPNNLHIHMPLLFVPELTDDQARVKLVKAAGDEYAASQNDGIRTIKLGGQKVAYTTPLDSTSTASELITDTLKLIGDGNPNAQGGFLPRLDQAVVSVPDIARITGRAADSRKTIRYSDLYAKNGFDAPNKAGVFAAFDRPIALNFPTGRTGIVTPNLSLNSLSQRVGPLPFSANSSGPANSPQDLKSLLGDAQLFGVIKLADIIESSTVNDIDPSHYATARAKIGEAIAQHKGIDEIEIALADTPLPAPSLTTQPIPTREKPNAIRTTYIWKPSIKPNDLLVAVGGPIKLILVVTITNPIGQGEPTFSIEGKLSNFGLEMSGIIRVDFESFKFTVRKGQKLQVDPRVHAIQFLGALEFLNPLQELAKTGLGGGVSLDVQPNGLTVSYSLGIPSIGIGIFSLENLRFLASFHLPFTGGKPMSFRFAFSSRNDPFRVSVALFAGGGFFALEFDTNGIRVIEASIEFGGSLSVDIVVAKGSAYVMAGFYFRLETTESKKSLHFEGYFRCGGSLEILGIITVSVELYLGFSYTKENQKAIMAGVARVTVEISIMFFSTSASLEMRIEYTVDGADPVFGDIFCECEWANYCQAFALED